MSAQDDKQMIALERKIGKLIIENDYLKKVTRSPSRTEAGNDHIFA
ncbi:hypothetical protein [Candidatus Paracaedibacter symbiosus]|nr:hypothetical protein [Candidatus Paracaedibacter symbiosus]